MSNVSPVYDTELLLFTHKRLVPIRYPSSISLGALATITTALLQTLAQVPIEVRYNMKDLTISGMWDYDSPLNTLCGYLS